MSASNLNSQAAWEWQSLAQTLARIFVVAVALNFPWELVQARLYVGMEDLSKVWLHCLKSSLGDGLLVLLIFAAGWIAKRDRAKRDRDWFKHPGVGGYVIMLVVGLAIGIGVERMGVYVQHKWAYTEQMPLLPGVEVGLAPVLQMLVLPPLIFYLAAWWGKKSPRGTVLNRTPWSKGET